MLQYVNPKHREALLAARRRLERAVNRIADSPAIFALQTNLGLVEGGGGGGDGSGGGGGSGVKAGSSAALWRSPALSWGLPPALELGQVSDDMIHFHGG